MAASKYIERLESCGIKEIALFNNELTDAKLAELVSYLLAHPDVVSHVFLGINELTDETGVKLAQYLASSSTIQTLSLAGNQFGEATYLAVASALHINTSLQGLSLSSNQAVDRTLIDAAFVEALRLNPDRSAQSMWWLYSSTKDFERLKYAAEQLGHPTLQELIYGRYLGRDHEE